MKHTESELVALARLRGLLATLVATMIREQAGVSLNAAARVVGVSRQTLTAWERGDFYPGKRTDAALRYLAFLDRLMSGGRDAT